MFLAAFRSASHLPFFVQVPHSQWNDLPSRRQGESLLRVFRFLPFVSVLSQISCLSQFEQVWRVYFASTSTHSSPRSAHLSLMAARKAPWFHLRNRFRYQARDKILQSDLSAAVVDREFGNRLRHVPHGVRYTSIVSVTDGVEGP